MHGKKSCMKRTSHKGAYISDQQYDESLETRLSLIAQDDGKPIWPQRQMNANGETISEMRKENGTQGKDNVMDQAKRSRCTF